MKTLIVLFAFVTLSVAPVLAQDTPPPGPPGGRPMERLDQLRKMRMVEMLDLKEDQSVRFFARLNEHDKERRELRRQKNELLDKVERLVRNHGDDNEYDPLFADITAIDQKIAESNRDFFNSLKDILTTEQRGKLLLFERRFESELREAFREARRNRGMEKQ